MKRIKKINDSNNLKTAIKIINNVYAEIPKTTGCIEHINKPKDEGGCGAWCCEQMNPQVLYSEFLNSWSHVLKTWDIEQILNLIESAILNYLENKPNKGCIFFDKTTLMCSQHNTRPYNCRMYGVVPKEEFEKRKSKYKSSVGELPMYARDQCSLVKTSDGSVITKSMSDDWWRRLRYAENVIGIKNKDVIDNEDGSYLTYHDHLLLQLLPDEIMSDITFIKVNSDSLEKVKTAKVIVEQLRVNLEKAIGGLK